MSSPNGAYIVTGAGSGIGQAIAVRIAQEGHPVFGLGRNTSKLEATAKLCGPGKFAFAGADLSDSGRTQNALGEIRKWLKTNNLVLRGLVNNAGVYDRLTFNESSDEIWRRQFEYNLLSAVRLTRELHAELKAGAPSSVLNISSTLGLRPIPMTSAYSAIKAAMNNWTQALAVEWGPDQIRVNAICPGLVDTPIHPFHKAPEDSEARKTGHALSPLGVMGKPENIAEAAWFLLSPASAWTTGTVMSLDGGIHL